MQEGGIEDVIEGVNVNDGYAKDKIGRTIVIDKGLPIVRPATTRQTVPHNDEGLSQADAVSCCSAVAEAP